MAQPDTDRVRRADDAARTCARALIAFARFGAVGVIDPDTGAPMVSRISVERDGAGQPMTLISDLARHTRALRVNPACSLLLGEPGPKGDPLTHPRLTLQCNSHFVSRTSDEHENLRARYLAQQPKARLYIDFGDFRLLRFVVTKAYLNGGFGKAYVLDADDLTR